MKFLLLFSLFSLAAPAANWAQRSPAPAAGRTETRTLPAFTSIDVASGIELVVQPGPSPAAVVDASTAQFRRMTKTVVEDGVLKVYFDYQHEPNWQGLVHSHEVFKVMVTTTELRALQAGARLVGAVQVQALDIQLRGGARAHLIGTVATLTLRVTEGSDFRGPRLQADQCTAFASSASTVRFAVRKILEASAVNEATITYSGPAQLTQERHEQGGQIMHF
jgi:hypothetical protein